jgi:hypothetical protein
MASRARIKANTTEVMASKFQRLLLRIGQAPDSCVTLDVATPRPQRYARSPVSVAAAIVLAASAWGCRPGAPPAGAPAPPKASSTGQPTAKAGKGELLIGQSAPFSGPSAQLGREYREGAMAWFTELNRRGGIHGRQLKLLSLDDRYEPDLTLVNTQRLIGTEQAFLLFGYVGTPTVKAVLPLIEQANIPMVAPLTGARLLREPSQHLVFNLRASYQSEIDKMCCIRTMPSAMTDCAPPVQPWRAMASSLWPSQVLSAIPPKPTRLPIKFSRANPMPWW